MGFGFDLFTSDESATQSDANEAEGQAEQREEAIRSFQENSQTKEGRHKIYKDILARGYVGFFTDGFSLKDVDGKFEHLSIDEKTQIIHNVIEALNLNLKQFSSADRQEKYLVIRQKQK